MTVFISILLHELYAFKRHLYDYIQPLIVFVLVIALFPLAVSPDPILLRQIAPGIIWIAAILATLMALENMFRQEFQSGYLDKLMLSDRPLSLLLLSKITAHWMMTSLPLVLVSPLLGMLLHLNAKTDWVLMLTLALGTPILNLIGAIGVGLTLGLRSQNLLILLLVLPLYVPVLIFGASAVSAAQAGLAFSAQIAMLGALLLIALSLVPWTLGAVLRIGVDG